MRVGYGLQGNQAVAPYASLATLAPDNQARYVFGNTIYTGIVPTVNANPDLKWEQSAQSNIAFDYGFLHSRFSGSLEYYSKKTTDLLLTVPVSQTGASFVSTQLQNIGSLQNRGFEASLDARLYERANRGVNLTAGLVFSIERNKVLDLGKTDFIETSSAFGNGSGGVNTQRIIPGQPIGTFYGPQFAGFNATGQQTFTKFAVTRDANGKETGRTANGVTTSPGSDDRIVIGNANPTFSLGLRSNATWKHFDASWLWRMEQGRDVFNRTALFYGTKANVWQDKNFLRSALSTPETLVEPIIFSSRYVENGSFLRLQNVTVGYAFKLPGSGRPVRASVSGDNLLLFTSYTGYDPEVFIDAGLASRGVDYLSYPRARTFTGGFHIAF